MNAHGASFREQRTQYAYDIRSAYGRALRIRVTWSIVFSSFLLSSFSTACYLVLSKSCRQLDAMLVNTMDQKLSIVRRALAALRKNVTLIGKWFAPGSKTGRKLLKWMSRSSVYFGAELFWFRILIKHFDLNRWCFVNDLFRIPPSPKWKPPGNENPIQNQLRKFKSPGVLFDLYGFSGLPVWVWF